MASKQGRFPTKRDNTYYIDGQKYPSVTEILSSVAKPFLIGWAAKQAAKAVLSDPYTYDTVEKAAGAVSSNKEGAAARGRAVHEFIERWANGEEIVDSKVPEEFRGYMRAFQDFIRAWNPKPVYTEVILFNETHHYAGRLDLVCEIGNSVWIVDFKTSKSVYSEYKLQQVAYKNAEFLWIAEHAVPMVKVDHTGIVLIHENGAFDFSQVDAPFEVFLSVKRLWEWLREA